jgi:hypothetical protein
VDCGVVVLHLTLVMNEINFTHVHGFVMWVQWFLLEAAACACAGKLRLSPAYLWRTFMNGPLEYFDVEAFSRA